MAVLFSPFVHGNIENYKEIGSESWHMSVSAGESLPIPVNTPTMAQLKLSHDTTEWNWEETHMWGLTG